MYVIFVHDVEIVLVSLNDIFGDLAFPGFVLTRISRLQTKVAVYFELSPYQISFLPFICETPPMSSFYQTSH